MELSPEPGGDEQGWRRQTVTKINNQKRLVQYHCFEANITNIYLICSGIRCTGEGFCQYTDYGIIEELNPDFKGQESVSGPSLLEMIPPPTPTTQYIQVHRLSGDENLSHLLLAYHHYGAAKAVIFVNTSDEFQLHQDLFKHTACI